MRRRTLSTVPMLVAVLAASAALSACGGKGSGTTSTQSTPGAHKPPAKAPAY